MSKRPGLLAAVARRWRLVLLLSSPLALTVPGHTLAQDAAEEAPEPPLTLPEIVAREQASDPWSLKIVTVRCTSFYISAAAVERDEHPEIANQYEENAELFLGRALSMSRENRDILINGLTRLSRMYYVLSEAARDANGDPFDHPLLRADLDFCARLAQQS
jgi:hypothetical protein